MKFKKLLSAAAFGLFCLSGAASAAEDKDVTYVRMVGDILELHLKALEYVVSSDSEYRSNAALHAIALFDSSEMLDHAVKEGSAAADNWPWKDEKQYEAFVEDYLDASKRLIDVAAKWVQEKDDKKIRLAIDNVKRSCGNCHAGKTDWN